jgi:purine nucleosidase
LLEPEICVDAGMNYVEIETGSELTRGMTVVDRLGVGGDARNKAVWGEAMERGRRVRVCWSIDVAGWKAALKRALA